MDGTVLWGNPAEIRLDVLLTMQQLKHGSMHPFEGGA